MPPHAAIVIPARDCASILEDCLATISEQARSLNVSVIVVDDGSTDDTSVVAASHGAQVISKGHPVGPYVARNLGWSASDAEVIVFTDARSRADEGWLASLLDAFEDEEVTVAGGPIRIPAGGTVAQRAAHLQQPLDPGTADPFLPWFPGANLAVRRTALEQLNGFEPSRGGGDVDLCWRAQVAGGRARYVAKASMWSAPRRRLRELLAQHHRYGANAARLDLRFAAHGRSARPPTSLSRAILGEARQGLSQLRSGQRDIPAVVAATLARTWYLRGYANEVRR